MKEANSEDRIWLLSAHLEIQACLLLAHSSAIQDMELSDLYGNACTMIEFAEELDKREQFASFGPTLLLSALHLAALLILRIGKSHVSPMLDLQTRTKVLLPCHRPQQKDECES